MLDIEKLRAFCWTKIQAEAGQSLLQIIARKELERAAGNGLFFWGVGNSLGEKVRLLRSGAVTKVVFSKMLSMPKRIDVDPSTVAVWLSYIDAAGMKRDLPSHVIVSSRGDTNGIVKKKHYAIACYSRAALTLGNCGPIDISRYKNHGSSNFRIGASQVTAVLERIEDRADLSRTQSIGKYQNNFYATLTNPHFVELRNPVFLTVSEVDELRNFEISHPKTAKYLAKAEGLRARFERRARTKKPVAVQN